MRKIIDALISLFIVITVIIVLTGGFRFYIGAYLVSARSLQNPLGICVILSAIRVLFFGNPFSTFSLHQLKNAAKQCLDLLAFLFLLISLFIFLSGGIQFDVGDGLVSVRSFKNPLIILVILVAVRSWFFGIPLHHFVERLVREKWELRQWVIFLLSVLIISATTIVTMYWFMKQGSLVPPPPGVSLTNQSIQSTKGLPRGFVVWSSNRYGNHDILRMDIPSKRITRLTTNNHNEYFPRISPDGSQIVFARSQRPWVSHRNQVHWDVYLMDLESGKQRLLAKNANTPTWSGDGKKVYFQRNKYSLGEFNIETGKEQILYTSGLGQVRKGAILQTPHFSDTTDRLAVTLRGRQHLTGLVDLKGNLTKIASGCQVAWSKRGDFLYYVAYGGRKKNALYLYDPVKKESRQWLDLPGELSHEYFPKLSNDEQYLILGASKGGREGHEHDTSDFEIFLWKIGTPADKAIRITHHTGNDNWPDIFFH